MESEMEWSNWLPLYEAWRSGVTAALPGLYRIRRVSRLDLDYIGQTGMGSMTIRARLGMLRGVYSNVMPYRDPHTAGPALWALRDGTGCEFEVSVAPVQGVTAWRKGLECVAIASYRQEHGGSPTVNFGRMPTGYHMSSGNNQRLMDAGRRFRGGTTLEVKSCHCASMPPPAPLDGRVTAGDWCGHAWQPWAPAAGAIQSLDISAAGLYRLRQGDGMDRLVYVGQGSIRNRLAAHVFKSNKPLHSQAVHFGPGLQISYVVNAFWLPHQRLEFENDLIAAHVLFLKAVPSAQFIG